MFAGLMLYSTNKCQCKQFKNGFLGFYLLHLDFCNYISFSNSTCLYTYFYFMEINKIFKKVVDYVGQILV